MSEKMESEFLGVVDRLTRGHDFDPEKRLAAEVLAKAIDDVFIHRYTSKRDGGEKRTKLYFDARNWLMSKDERYVFSFRSICDIFDIDPDRLCSWLRLHKIF